MPRRPVSPPLERLIAAVGLLVRLTVRDDRTRTFGFRRILKAPLEAESRPLVMLASHWISRVTDPSASAIAASGRGDDDSASSVRRCLAPTRAGP